MYQLHKDPCKQIYIAESACCSKLLSAKKMKIFTMLKKGVQNKKYGFSTLYIAITNNTQETRMVDILPFDTRGDAPMIPIVHIWIMASSVVNILIDNIYLMFSITICTHHARV